MYLFLLYTCKMYVFGPWINAGSKLLYLNVSPARFDGQILNLRLNIPVLRCSQPNQQLCFIKVNESLFFPNTQGSVIYGSVWGAWPVRSNPACRCFCSVFISAASNMWFCLQSSLALCQFFPPSWDNLLTLKYLFVSLPSVFSHSLSFCLLCLIWWEDKLPTFHVCLFVVSLCACRSPTSPGRGGLLFSRCLRTLSGRPGVCLPKRYHNPAVPCVWLGLNLVSDVTAFLAMVSSPF